MHECERQAADAGVFGVPTFIYDGTLFWGADETDFLLDALDDPQDGSVRGTVFFQPRQYRPACWRGVGRLLMVAWILVAIMPWTTTLLHN